MRGELDWIVMKALEKDRNRRYETANGFAMDVQRYLADEPVQACPPSAGYRLRKFARRNKAALLVTTSLMMVLFAALSASLVVMWRENQWSNRALQQATAAEQQATAAERTQRAMLAKSYLEEARGRRKSGQFGQRFESLRKLKEATRIARDLELPPEFVHDLRNEAIACLSLPDVEVAREWDGFPPDSDQVDFDPTFERYARSDSEGDVSVRRVGDDAEIASLRGDGKPVFPRFSPDGHCLAAQAHSGREGVKVWRLDGGEPSVVVNEPRSREWLSDFSPDGRLFVAAGGDDTIVVYELPSGKPLRRLEGHPIGGSGWMTFHPKDPLVAVITKGGNSVRIVDVETGKVRADLTQANTSHIAWHPDGRMLAVASNDGAIYLWDTQERRRVSVHWGHTAPDPVVAFNHAGDLLLSNNSIGLLRVLDPQTGRLLFQTSVKKTPALRFSRDDELFGPDWEGGKLRVLAGRRRPRVAQAAGPRDGGR